MDLNLDLVEPGGLTSQIPAGAPFRLVLNVPDPSTLLRPGEGLRVVLPHYHGFSMASVPQETRESSPGYTRLLAAPPGSVLELPDPDVGALLLEDTPLSFAVRLDESPVTTEPIGVIYGFGKAGAARAQALAIGPASPGYRGFECWKIDSAGRPLRLVARADPEFVAASPRRLEIVAPTVVRPSAPFHFRVLVKDGFGNPALADLRPLEWMPAEGAPATDSSQPRTSRTSWISVRHPGITAPGVYRFAARCGKITGKSNPVRVDSTAEAVLFGDLHVHCGQISPDGTGSLQQVFQYGRQLEGLDFVGSTDHDGDVTAGSWQLLRERLKQENLGGDFQGFLGFEWTPAYSWGHRSVIFPGLEGEPIPCGRPPGDSPEGLWQGLRQYGALAIPHLPSAEIIEHHLYDWSHHDPELERLVEVHSQWSPGKWKFMAQDSETNPRGVQYALTLGYRLGLIAGSDNHSARAGRTGGLAAAMLRRPGREGLWEALRSRRVYGTTGERMLLDFRTDDASAGEESPSRTGPVELTLDVHGTAPLDRVELVKGWTGATVPLEAVHVVRFPPELLDGQVSWTDPDPLPEAFYYARVFQRNGGLGWTSPIWFNRPGLEVPLRESSRTRAWSNLPLPSGWKAGSWYRPSRDPIDLTQPGPDGFTLDLEMTQVPDRSDTVRMQYFHVRGEPLNLTGGKMHRFRYELRGQHPGVVLVALLDEELRNPGFFAVLELAEGRLNRKVEETFRCQAATAPARLHFFFPAEDNRYQVQGLTLEAEQGEE